MPAFVLPAGNDIKWHEDKKSKFYRLYLYAAYVDEFYAPHTCLETAFIKKWCDKLNTHHTRSSGL